MLYTSKDTTPSLRGPRRRADRGRARLDGRLLQLERLPLGPRRRRGCPERRRSFVDRRRFATFGQDLPVTGHRVRTTSQHEYRLGRRSTAVSGGQALIQGRSEII